MTGSRLPNLLLLAASVIATLLGVEVCARLAGWGEIMEFVPDEDWGFLMRPSIVVHTYGHPVAINALGLRGPEVRDPKPPGTKRILFVGDSVTYGGSRIREEQLFCRIVESRGRGEGLNIEAVNLSAPAWAPQNWLEYVEKRGLHGADLVVLTLPECDLARPFASLDRAGFLERAPALRLMFLGVRFKTRFFQREVGPPQDRDEAIAANLKAVIRLREMCRSVPLIVLLVPSWVPQRSRQPALPKNDELWSLFTAELTGELDLRQELQDPAFFLDELHLSVKGHAYVGEKLFQRLRPAAFSPRSRSE